MWNVETIRPILELAIVLPAAVSCFLPVRDHLRVRGRFIVLWGVPLLVLWALLGGMACYSMGWEKNIWLFSSLPLFIFLYCRLVDLPFWKPVSVALGICGTFSCLSNLAIAADAYLAPNNASPWLTFQGAALYNLFAWTLMGLLFYPIIHGARWLINQAETPRTWHIFWILPSFFVGINLLIQPVDYATLYAGRMMVLYPVAVLFLLVLLLFFYLMFWTIARELGNNMRLQQENHFLQIQASQYSALRKSIEETQRTRHDLRQHLTAIQGFIDRGDLNALADYIKICGTSIPSDTMRSYCGNPAVDAVVRYYADKAAELGTDMEVSIQIGAQTIIPEPEFCVLLGNLLENALEACAELQGKKYVRVSAIQTGNSMLSLTVDNTSAKPPVVEMGKFRSSKRDGFGIGIESARTIAEHYNGDARFQWKEGVFYASVMLNP